MEQEPIKNQWRVLLPESPLSPSSFKLAHESGFHGIVLEKETDVFPLKPILKISSSPISPFSDAYLKDVPKGRSLFWESALFHADWKKEMLERALLPHELLLLEIEKLVKIASRETIFYRIPDQFSERFQERHLDQLLRRSDLSVCFVHSAVSGHPKRLDLPAHPLLEKQNPRLLPIYHAAPLEGELKLPLPSADRYCLMVSEGWSVGQDALDTRLCYLQAIVQGEENPPPEELRLLADLLIAEMRYELKRGQRGNHEQKKRLLVRSLEKLRVPVPLSLTMD